MKKKNNITKNIFFCFFALCFFSAGMMTLNSFENSNVATAENLTSEEVENGNLPEYFLAQEFLNETLNEDSLASHDTFMYFEEGGKSTNFKLSLKMNENASVTNDIYKWVYYPDPSNLSVFYFYNISSISLYVNGENQNINMGDYTKTSSLSFPSKAKADLQGFEMIFNNSGMQTNAIKILDEQGNVKEGVYSLSLTYTLYSCTDGGQTLDEREIVDIATPTINYSFYVIDRDNYITNNRPNFNYQNFDHDITLSNPNFAYYLYSNYSSEGANSYKIPYIEYDYTRFELDISKDFQNQVTNCSLLFDKDSVSDETASSVLLQGENIVKFKTDKNTHKTRVYFTDVGDYSIKYNAIQIVNNLSQVKKYNLTGVTTKARRVNVYMFGYQAEYTDLDGRVDENGMRPMEELKFANTNSGTFEKSADITSGFLNSNASYSQENANSTFLINNVLNYIKNNKISAQVTNQTPIKFVANANLSTSISSYVYSTTKVSSAYTPFTSETGDKLYYTNFSGRADSTAGTYIYIIAYNYKNFYENEATQKANKTFYQVFYFELVKELPTVEIKTAPEDGSEAKNVPTETFVNQKVVIKNTLNEENIYNKDVTVQIYAQDYNNNWNFLTGFGGNEGINLANIEGGTLTADAKYTIRLYYTNEITSTNILFDTQERAYFREQTFTIDTSPIQNITGKNVSEILGTTNYKIGTTLTSFATNQDMIFGWDKKNSLVETYAYYRYFPIVSAQYYSNNANYVSSVVSSMLNYNPLQGKSYLPVNYVLNMDTGNNSWLQYKGNTVDMTSEVSSEYVFSDAGLYLVDVYDKAGNHSMQVFMIDNTSPIFAIYDSTNNFQLTSKSMYITEASTLYWAKNKSLYMSNFKTLSYNSNYNPSNVTEDNLKDYEFYKTYDNKISTDIFKLLYNNLYKSYMDLLTCNTPISDGVSTMISNYSGYYINIPINSTSCYKNDDTGYKMQSNVFSQAIDVTDEGVYTILIRDEANTKYDLTSDKTAMVQFTSYASARQTIIISHDSSHFVVQYTDKNLETVDMVSNNSVVETINVNDEAREKKTTYLSPTKMNKLFTLAFTPTTNDSDTTIQVNTVLVKYYPYENKQITLSGVTYHYMQLSDSYTVDTVYDYAQTGASTNVVNYEIRPDADNFTRAGKYEITRTYYVDKENNYNYNETDYYERTFVLYVDRNEVVSPAEAVTDKIDDVSGKTHLESLVGGDVFIAMYDNKTNANLVVTFPNSEEGNSDGSTIYNNGEPRNVLTTNMLPVNLYIPEYKYTTYTQKVLDNGQYEFVTNFETYKTNKAEVSLYLDQDTTSEYTNNETRLTEGTQLSVLEIYANSSKVHYNGKMLFIKNVDYSASANDNYFYENSLIREYALFAEIYKNGTESSNILAKSTLGNSPVAGENGFMNFYKLDGTKLEYLSEAGTYYIKLYQGRFGDEKGADNENNFESALTFCFQIKSTNPDFYAQTLTGTNLEQRTITQGSSTVDVYYTNQSNLNLIWEAGSTFMADIEIDEVTFTKYSGETIKYKDKKNVFVEEPILTNGLYVAQLDLNALDVYRNDRFVDITMQYKNFDEKFYSKVTKRIYVDLSAPSTNVQALVDKATAGSISYLTNSSLRTYYTAKENEKTTDLNNTSYNVSNNSDPLLKYYSYSVTKNYLQTLKSSAESEKIFVRKFVDKDGNNTKYNENFNQETTPSEFLESSFTNIRTENIDFDPNFYYEIIEMDRAGNMSIYTVYITDYQSSDESLISLTKETDEISYTKNDYSQAKAYTNAIHNIYAPTGYQLDMINFFGDEWAQFKMITRGTDSTGVTRSLMLSPWDKKNAYYFVGSKYNTIPIDDLIDSTISSKYKSVMTFYNRENQTNESFYVNIRNTLLDAELTNDQEKEYIRFSKLTDTSIQDPLYSRTYLTALKITVPEKGLVLYEPPENNLGYASLWQSSTNVTVTLDNTSETITFALNEELKLEPDTRIVYEYKDNYGTTYTEIHLFKETIITQEIGSGQDLYSYYDDTGKLIYITKDDFKFMYNNSKYIVKVFEFVDANDERGPEVLAQSTGDAENPKSEKAIKEDIFDISKNYNVISIKSSTTASYDSTFVVKVYDKTNPNAGKLDEEVKSIYFRLYNELPLANYSEANNSQNQFKLIDANGNNITEKIIPLDGTTSNGYFSEVRLQYSQKETFLPIKYSISKDKIDWEEISSGTRLKCLSDSMEKYYLKIWYDEKYLANETGTTAFVFGYVPESQIFEFNLSSLTATYWIELELDGKVTKIEKENSIYKSPVDGKQYTNHYLVNVDYSFKDAVTIKTNEELGIVPKKAVDFLYNDSTNVKSEHWIITNKKYDEHGELIKNDNIPPYETDIIITYIPNSDNFVEEFYTYNLNGVIDTSENLINLSAKSVVVGEDYAGLNSIELQWTKYYGISQNEIKISIQKDDIKLAPTIYTRRVQIGNQVKEYNYLYLTHSGKYTISLYDSTNNGNGNIQKFSKGTAGQTETFTLIFLKDVPFTMTYTNPKTNEQETSVPIKQAVYNGEVSINIDSATRSEFYTLDGYPVISVKRNGVEYKDFITEKSSYLFTEAGYYEVYFTAISSLPNIGKIRQETYEFTILDPEEFRYSYIYNSYSNYYVEQVTKDGVDITENLLKSLDVSTITVGQKKYITSLPLSYLDEKTGSGTYMITINSNDKFYENSSMITKWTYQVKINVGSAPIKISVTEGTETTSAINVVFNQENIFNEMGKCTLRIVSYIGNTANVYNNNSYDINENSVGQISTNIEAAGTYYIQIVTARGENVLYSYKVIKKDPMNAASIIAIVISVLVAIAIVFIIIKLRKRISVK